MRERHAIRVCFYHHYTLYLYAGEWERITYLASGANKTPSRYIVDCVMEQKKIPAVIKRDNSKHGIVKSLSCDEREWQAFKDKIDASGQKMGDYIMNIILSK